MKKLILTILCVSVSLVGCTTSSKDIATNYVSPIQFQSYDCDQLQSEAVRIQSRVSQLGGRLDEAASNDKTITGVSMILFWPALFALGGTKQQEAEYARLKGEYDAIQQSSVNKKCFNSATKTVRTEKPLIVTSVKSRNEGVNSPEKNSEEKLIELKRLFDAGLISTEVYSAQQAAILGG
ncbi:hypothetical protein [Rhodoferax sp.]|uniref:hypothetical protein n=1 Tax=Rhodoferax sp. TaxID=50421 RepID=UPI002605E8D2|nr:hypothetical protein [Rhodoferax sp.]MDD4942729.1 hypothetical protein [Rhodoferax sp.]MDD5479982.1 hypothetical protein [Rhodoferax sp.]